MTYRKMVEVLVESIRRGFQMVLNHGVDEENHMAWLQDIELEITTNIPRALNWNDVSIVSVETLQKIQSSALTIFLSKMAKNRDYEKFTSDYEFTAYILENESFILKCVEDYAVEQGWLKER